MTATLTDMPHSLSPADEPRDPYAIHLIINGELGMSPGKIAAQAFQACQRIMRAARGLDVDDPRRQLLNTWEQEGTRTCVMIAQTPHIFARAQQELGGEMMIDEGMNEVEPGSATIYATWPIRRSEQPQILRHKRLKIWKG